MNNEQAVLKFLLHTHISVTFTRKILNSKILVTAALILSSSVMESNLEGFLKDADGEVFDGVGGEPQPEVWVRFCDSF